MTFWLWYLFCGDAYIVFTSKYDLGEKSHVLKASEKEVSFWAMSTYQFISLIIKHKSFALRSAAVYCLPFWLLVSCK